MLTSNATGGVTMADDRVFRTYESEVRSYCRSFPAVFTSSHGSFIEDEEGKRYIDFLSGAGALNYGHNNPAIMEAVLAYLQRGGVLHSLDLYTRAKREFIESFQSIILAKRGLYYRLQFPGPAGTTAVEAAMKIARKVTGRPTIAAFTNGFHGMTLGALAATSNSRKRKGAHVGLNGVFNLPYDGYYGTDIDTIPLIERLIEDPGSGFEKPAAFLLETVQGEGGLNVASNSWLIRLADMAHRHKILLIVDDIQAGCGRTGPFFSFEDAGITPDVVCLSKAIGGIGFPMALVLLKPEYDRWLPGEHNGTFRGNNLAFVAGTVALEFWRSDQMKKSVHEKSVLAKAHLSALVRRYLKGRGEVKGKGLMIGIAAANPDLASKLSHAAFSRGLIVETCGPHDEVIKLLPPLTIDLDVLKQGLGILEAAFGDVTGVKPDGLVAGLGATV